MLIDLCNSLISGWVIREFISCTQIYSRIHNEVGFGGLKTSRNNNVQFQHEKWEGRSPGIEGSWRGEGTLFSFWEEERVCDKYFKK